MLTANLDRKNDILYVNFSDTKNSYGDEIDNGLVCLYDMFDNNLTGVTVFDFMKRYNSGVSPLKKPINGLDFEKQVLPVVKSKYHLR